jgi:hypothetical protein
MFPRWLPLYLLGIAAITLFPFLPAECESPGWVMRMGRADFAANLFAFVPIGLALHRSPLLRAIALSFALSLTIELCQGFLPRLQDVSDLISNTLGAFIGHRIGVAWAARWEEPLLRPVTRRIVLLATAPVLLTGALAEAFVAPANDFSNWSRFPLVIGNSARGDRPWMGEISEVSVFDRALAVGETTPSGEDPAVPELWAEGGPILWLRFRGEEPSGRVDGPSGPVRYVPEIGRSTVLTEASLQLLPSGVALAGWVSDHVVEQLRRTGELTLDVRFRAAVERQYGPARIVSLGEGRRLRNLMLGQRGAGLVARIRTPANGRGGSKPEVETGGVVTREPQHVRLTYDGSQAMIHVDGICEDATHMAVANALPMMGPFLGVTLVLGTALPALAVASFSRNSRRRLVLALAGGGGAWGLLWASGIWDHLGDFTLVALLLGAIALVTTVPLLRQPR